MGILAQCPNGHGIKVKDQYAGRKVTCPQCGAAFRVPAAALPAGGPARLPVARVVPLDSKIIATLPRAAALDAALPAGSSVTALPVPTSFVPPPEPAEPAPAVAAPPASFPPAAFPSTPPFVAPVPMAVMHPLIVEQPAAHWSLALPGGEASAPMTGLELQHWLDARQATGAELVWRSDWPDWLPIGQVFSEYLPPAAP